MKHLPEINDSEYQAAFDNFIQVTDAVTAELRAQRKKDDVLKKRFVRVSKVKVAG